MNNSSDEVLLLLSMAMLPVLGLVMALALLLLLLLAPSFDMTNLLLATVCTTITTELES